MMTHYLRKWLIRVSIPLSWSRNDPRVAASLEDFALTEADSAWQMLQAAHHTDEPALQAEFLETALEELRHAALFRQAAHSFRAHPGLVSLPARQGLCTSAASLGSFMAYQYVGEHEIHDEFSCYARACPKPAVSQIFLAIQADEACHQADAHSRLSRWFPTPAHSATAIRRASLRRDLEGLERLGHRIGRLVSGLLLLPVFLVSGLLFHRACRQRLASSGWYNSNPALDRLRRLE